MDKTRAFLKHLGLPSGDLYDLPDSKKRFPDGAQYRIEIPSVEGPKTMKAVLETAQTLKVPIHRISQGSGIMLLTDDEIKEMVQLGKEYQVEVSLFVGPRAGFDIGALPFTPAGKAIAQRLRGMDQIVYAIEDIKRACALGIRGILVADEGLLWIVNELKKQGELPTNLVVKVSVQMGQSNPISIRMMEQAGANTYNIPTDLTLPMIAAIRQAIDIPVDVYVEVPDNFGGFIRYYEIAELIRIAAPIYVKFGLRNSPDIYPSGTHLETTSINLGKERVRRAKIGFDMIQRYYPQATMSKPGAEGIGLPE
jgi:hypothetical protein